MTSERESTIEPERKPSRRHLLTSGLLAGTSVAAFAVGQRFGSGSENEVESTASELAVEHVSAYGEQQPGITVPQPRQQYVLISVYSLGGLAGVPELLDEVGHLAVQAQAGEMLSGIAPGNLTVTAGVGPRIIRHYFSSSSPGGTDLPAFKNDDFDSPRHADGDLVIQICSDDPTATSLLQNHLATLLRSRDATLNWQSQGFRGAVDQGIGRNLLGFHDGVSVPHTNQELDDLVWIQQPAPFRNTTVMVVRRMPIDVQDFTALPTKRQEEIIGRERTSGAPLSGGALMDDPNLHAKSSSGEFDIPLGAHVRRAHPLPSGAKGLMLRRSYSYFTSDTDQGLLFISFQSELKTFVATQHRMDELDDLMDMTRTTASGTFLVGPGQTQHRTLGDFLRTEK